LIEWFKALRQWYRGLGLAGQFVIASSVIIGLGMALLGLWVADRIERGVIQHASANAALHLDGFVEPQLQALAADRELPETARSALATLASVPVHTGRQSLVALTIWGSDGHIIYSTLPGLTGQTRLLPAKVSKAWVGNVEVSFELTDEHGFVDRKGQPLPILKVYAPMHQTGTNRVIGVVEVYESGEALVADIRRVNWQTAGIFGLLTLGMLAPLSGIVLRGGNTIASQQQALSQRIADLSLLLKQNEELQTRVVEANKRSTDINDKYLRRISAELHDGPVQLIALALLQLEGMRLQTNEAGHEPGGDEELKSIEGALRDALGEIREMSAGLSLPKIEGSTVKQVLEYAIFNHERRTRTRVKTQFDPDLPKQMSTQVLTCLYRFTQEGLNNAAKHAGGKDQTVTATFDGQTLNVEVCDSGSGFVAVERGFAVNGHGLGLTGLKNRVESLGGTFDIDSTIGAGTHLKASFERSALEL
jgi:signal transduction histidine kinase